MLGGFYCIQIATFFTIYKINIPGNAEVYTDEFRKLISFDAIKPDKVLKMVNENWTPDAIFGNAKQKLSGAAESSGFESTSFLYNMRTYIGIFAVFMAMMLVLGILSCFKSRLQDYAKNEV